MKARELQAIIKKNKGKVAFGAIFQVILSLYKDNEEIPDEVVRFAITDNKPRNHYFYCGENLSNRISQCISNGR